MAWRGSSSAPVAGFSCQANEFSLYMVSAHSLFPSHIC